MKIARLIKKTLNLPPAQWEKFILKTHNKHNQQAKYSKEEESLLFTKHYKAYARMPATILPRPLMIEAGLQNVLESRKSERSFSRIKVELQTVSNILYYSVGINNIQQQNPDKLKRFYPSAGARYPIETYILSMNIRGLKQGVYHYYPKTHLLEHLTELPNNLSEFFVYDWVLQSAFVVILTSIFKRTTLKYQNRGYNYTLLEAGHIGQNFALVANSLKIGSCSIGGFVEAKMDHMLNIKLPEETSIYCMCFGYPKKS